MIDGVPRRKSVVRHGNQPGRRGGPDEYAQIEETFTPDALNAITEWLNAQNK